MTGRSPVLSIPVTAGERALLEAAAEQARTSLGEFARRKLMEALELQRLEPRPTVIAAADWERFEAWAHEPAREVPALRRLAETRPAWKG